MLVSFLFTISISLNINFQAKVNTLTDGIIESKNEQAILQKLTFLALNANAYAASYLMSSADDSRKTYLSKHGNEIVEVNNQLKLIINSHYHDNEELAAIAAFDQVWNAYLTDIYSVFQAFQDDAVQEAHNMYASIQFDPVIHSLISYTDKLSLFISEREEELTAFEAFVTKFNIAVTLITILLAIGVSLFISNRIEKPVLRVNQQLKEIAEGEGDLTKEISVASRDEIGDLAQFFNQMIASLRHMIQHIGNAAEQVASSSHQLMASSQQTSQTTEHISQITKSIAGGTERQVYSIQGSVVTINEMSQGIRRMAANIQEVSQASNYSSEIAQSGSEAIQTAIHQMGTIKRSIHDLANMIQALSDRSQAINQIAAIITDIAQKTHLLSLNATIEAAHAGEQGKGFAVVAYEVKKLSVQTDYSAKQINDLIDSIHNDTSQAIRSMEASITEVQAGTSVIDQAGKSFGKIQSSVVDVSVKIEELSAFAEQIEASSEEVVQAMQIVAQLSKEAAAGTQSVFGASGEQAASMEELASSAAYLSQMAMELQSLVHKFKV